MQNRTNKVFKEYLRATYPLLYRGRISSHRDSKNPIPIGIGVGKGWYGLIEDLSTDLELILEKLNTVTPKTLCECGHLHEHHVFEGAVYKGDPAGSCNGIFKVPYKLKLGKAFSIDGSKLGKAFSIDGSKLGKYLYKKKLNLVIKINSLLLKLSNKFGIHKRIRCKCSYFHANHPRAVQVKEKFGSLRFYMSSYNIKTSNLIHFYENLSTTICETCGDPGERRSGGWLKTLCDVHAEGRETFSSNFSDNFSFLVSSDIYS